jgi:hypothetical protein
VLVYYGADRNRSVAHLSRHDVVITTYQVLAQDVGAPGNWWAAGAACSRRRRRRRRRQRCGIVWRQLGGRAARS